MEQNKIVKKSFIQSTLLSLFTLLLFSACSTKEVYKPKHLESEWQHSKNSSFTIADTDSNVALLEDNKVLTRKGVVDVDINSSYRLISQSDDWIISATIDGNLSLVSTKNSRVKKSINLKKTVASASISGDELAVLFADNEIALYNLNTKTLLFRAQGGKSIVSDSRIVNPRFIRGVVLFATLDGKVIFVNDSQKKRLRSVIVSSEENFNNVISLDVIQNRIIAATSYGILSIAQKEIRAKYEIRDIVYDKSSLYIATKQGEIISLMPDLQVISKIKFPFAHFYGMISDGDKLYILEKEGYMIVVDKKSFDYTVHEVSFDSDGFIFIAGKKFFIDDTTISVE